MLEWHEKVWQKKNFSVKFERPADMYSRSERPVVIIQNILKEGFGNWDKSYMAPGVKEAIGKIPDPGRIKRVVCVGLGLIECARFEASLNETHPSRAYGASLAQHVAALAIVKQLQDMTKKKVQLYTADPAYGPSHKEALETLDKVESIGIKFNVCDVSYGRHEQYLKINDDTLLFTVAAYCGVLRAVSEYTRPAVMICEGLCRDTNQDPERPSPDYLWYEVKPREIKGMGDERTSVKIPGVPRYVTLSIYTIFMLTLSTLVIIDGQSEWKICSETNTTSRPASPTCMKREKETRKKKRGQGLNSGNSTSARWKLRAIRTGTIWCACMYESESRLASRMDYLVC